MIRFIMLFYMVSFVSSCSYSQDTLSRNNQSQIINLLFIGNSLTYTNNLPKLVERNALRNGITVKTKMIAYPNYAIVDHWAEGEVQQLIETKKYDFVIIQQGPSSQDDGRTMLMESGSVYKDLCEANNAKLCYFMVWPSVRYYNSFDGVIKNHRDAAIANEALLIPVGELWRAYIENTKKYDYYSADGFHPSVKGSEMAANVIVEYLLIN